MSRFMEFLELTWILVLDPGTVQIPGRQWYLSFLVSFRLVADWILCPCGAQSGPSPSTWCINALRGAPGLFCDVLLAWTCLIRRHF